MRATIVMSLPAYGIAIVTPTADIAKDSPNLHIAYIGANSTYYGGAVKSVPCSGTTVLCVPDPESDSAFNIVAVESYNPVTADIGNGNRTNAISTTMPQPDQECLMELANNLFDMYPAMKADVVNKGVLFNFDAEGGDLDISDSQGYTGVRTCRFSSTLQGSQMAYVEASEPENKVYIQGVNYELNTLLTEHAITPEAEVNNMAVSLPESLGSAYAPETKVAPKEDATTETGAIEGISVQLSGETQTGDKVYGELRRDGNVNPLFRLSTVRGRVVDGEQDTVLGTPGEDGNPPILSKRRRGLDGDMETASVFRICSVKTPEIHGMLQAKYVADKKDSEDPKDLRTPIERIGTMEYLNPNELDKEDNVETRWFNGMSFTNTPMSSDLLSEACNAGFAQSTLRDDYRIAEEPGGAVPFKEYTQPQSDLDVTSPVNKDCSSDAYKTTSIITQEPNGDIVLSDGFGSEIRMRKGNIYISSALDTYIMPGRDLITMAGGEQSYTSRKGCTIKAGTSLHAAAGKDFKACGGLDGEASSVLLENSAGNVDILSRGGTTAINGNNVFIGRRSPGARPKSNNDRKGIKENDVISTPGSIVFDAGSNGSLCMESSTVDILSKTSITAAVCDPSKSADGSPAEGTVIQATSQTVDFLSKNTRISGSVTLSDTSANLAVRIPGKDGKTVTEVPVKTGEAGQSSSQRLRLNVSGAINCDNAMVNSAAIVKGTLIGKSIGSVSGSVGTVSLTDENGEISKMWQQIPVPEIVVQQAYLAGLVSGARLNQGYLSNRLWQAAFSWGKSLPPYQESPLELDAYRWQLWYYLGKERNSKAPENEKDIPRWKEKPCISDATGENTYPYPGKSWWEDGVLYNRVLSESQQKSGYIVNSDD